MNIHQFVIVLWVRDFTVVALLSIEIPLYILEIRES
jgi:hypothetical protein